MMFGAVGGSAPYNLEECPEVRFAGSSLPFGLLDLGSARPTIGCGPLSEVKTAAAGVKLR
jgi:hypothetical protein